MKQQKRFVSEPPGTTWSYNILQHKGGKIAGWVAHLKVLFMALRCLKQRVGWLRGSRMASSLTQTEMTIITGVNCCWRAEALVVKPTSVRKELFSRWKIMDTANILQLLILVQKQDHQMARHINTSMHTQVHVCILLLVCRLLLILRLLPVYTVETSSQDIVYETWQSSTEFKKNSLNCNFLFGFMRPRSSHLVCFTLDWKIIICPSR